MQLIFDYLAPMPVANWPGSQIHAMLSPPDNGRCWSIRWNGLCKNAMRQIRMIVSDNHIDSKSYQLARHCNPFLQSFVEDDGFVMVEFWTNDLLAIMNYVRHLFAEVNPTNRRWLLNQIWVDDTSF